MRTSLKHFLKLIALGAFAAAPLAAHATDVTIDGNVGYEASGGSVTITVDQVTNNSSTDTSGSLYLTLWATTGSSPGGSGYELAQVYLGELTPNQYYYDIVQTTTFTAPPDGTYYVHLLLSEYPDLDSYIDYRTFDTTATFDGGSSGGGGGGGGGGGDGSYISIEGNVSYDATGDTVYLEVERVANNSSTTTSGTLYLKLWATTTSSPVGSGYTLASTELGTLAPGTYYYDIIRTLDFDAPPGGTYYIHLIVTEYPNTDTILDSVTFPGTEYFSGSGGGGGGDPEPDSGDDGGGGALHPAWLLVLAGAVAGLRRRRAAA